MQTMEEVERIAKEIGISNDEKVQEYVALIELMYEGLQKRNLRFQELKRQLKAKYRAKTSELEALSKENNDYIYTYGYINDIEQL